MQYRRYEERGPRPAPMTVTIPAEEMWSARVDAQLVACFEDHANARLSPRQGAEEFGTQDARRRAATGRRCRRRFRTAFKSCMSEKELRPAQSAVRRSEGGRTGSRTSKFAIEHGGVAPDRRSAIWMTIKLEKLIVEARRQGDGRGAEELRRLSRSSFEAAREERIRPRWADQVAMDFVGTVDGEPFEGGTGEDMTVELGSGPPDPRLRRPAGRREGERSENRQGHLSGRLQRGLSEGRGKPNSP